MYTALIHRPGCLPDATDPLPEFVTPAEAWRYLADERALEEDQHADHPHATATTESSGCSATHHHLTQLADRQAPSPDWDGTGTVHGPTPGHDSPHDLGWCYTVLPIIEPAQTPGHDHTGHDANGDLASGPDRCPHCGAPSHCDETIGDYQHDDSDGGDCFLIRRHTPCRCSTVGARPGSDKEPQGPDPSPHTSHAASAAPCLASARSASVHRDRRGGAGA